MATQQTIAFPKKIFAHASPISLGGVSLFNTGSNIDEKNVARFQSEGAIVDRAVSQLRSAGFDILQVTPITINIAGTKSVFEKAFNTKLEIQQRDVIKPGSQEALAEFVECPKTAIPGLISMEGTTFENTLEGIALEEPRYFMAPSVFPPWKSYWHLDVPNGVSVALNAEKPHRAGITGSGIKVAMIDSGHCTHPFFTSHGYRVSPVILGPGASNPTNDENGHGTAESANIFAVAPDVELQPIKWSFVNSVAAVNSAIALNPDIITCSWGSSKQNGPLSASDQALAAAIAAAKASGIVVIFSAGNGHWGFPGQVPDCISAGGVFMDSDSSMRASDYSSGFMSNIYQNRQVPDVCGLVGMLPRAAYIMLPLEEGCNIDSNSAGGTHPNGDETANNDGWAAISGTSAAAPQLAGLAALMKSACSRLTPDQIKDIMKKTARDIVSGTCHPNTGGNSAVAGPDNATGHGLVDAHKAVLLAKLRCMTIRSPRGPITPGPIGPVTGPEPRGPITPGPRGPGVTPPGIDPRLPHPEPIQPQPIPPGPVPPIQPGYSYEDYYSSYASQIQTGTGKFNDDDLDTLEDLIINSDLD